MYNWEFSSRKERPKGWYVIALIVVLFLIVYGIWTGAYIMPIACFLFAGVYLLIENNSTPLVQVQITQLGIQVQGEFYEYAKMSAFAILYEDTIPCLIRITLRKGIVPILDIPLSSEIDVAGLRSFLAQYVEESTKNEFTKSDRIIQAMRL